MYNPIDNVLDSALCKTTSNDGQLHRWKAWDAKTPFAPTFDMPMWLDDIDKSLLPEILKALHENNEGNYRQIWEKDNLFNWTYPVFDSLKKEISRIYSSYLSALEIPRNKVWIRAWAVYLTPREEIKLHCHSYHENTWVSGNISLNTGTTTDYNVPHLSLFYGPWRVANRPGRVTLFPSWVEHEVKEVFNERYSIGFDLFSDETMEYIHKNRNPRNEHQNIILRSVCLE
jgi:hypothetical protein